MSKLQKLRNTFPEYQGYSDEAVAAAVWNRFYRNEMPFDEFSKMAGYKEGVIPRETPPPMPTPEQAREQGPGFLERTGRRVMENIQAVPIIGAAARGLTAFGRLPGAGRLPQMLGTASAPLVPKTGTELAKQTGVAAVSAPIGLATGELAAPLSRVPGEIIPAPAVRGPEGRQRLEQVLRTGLEPVGEVLTGAAATRAATGVQRRLAERPAGIPAERIEAVRAMPQGAVPASQVMRGAEISPTQEVFNRQYNRLVGNPESKDFGRREFTEARNRLSSEYDRLLTGRQVTFDEQFFADIQDLLNRQRSLAQTGVMFAEARPIINTLSQIATLPSNLQARAAALRDIPADTTDIAVNREALALIDEAMKSLRGQTITMDARIYNDLRSQLGDAAYRTADRDRAKVLRGMQQAFDQAADRSLPREVARDLGTTRNQYENLKILEEAQKGAEPGLILPQRVGQVSERRAGEGFIYGDKEMYDLGRKGLSLGMKPEPAQSDLGLMDVLPTQIGGVRQKVGIMERGVRGITEPARARAITQGPRTEEEMVRRMTPSAVRPLGQAVERAVGEAGMPEFEEKAKVKEQQ